MSDTPTIPAGVVLRIEGDLAYYDRIDGRLIVADYHDGVISNPRFDPYHEATRRTKPLPGKWIEVSTPRQPANYQSPSTSSIRSHRFSTSSCRAAENR